MDKKTEGLNSSTFSLEPFKQFVKTALRDHGFISHNNLKSIHKCS